MEERNFLMVRFFLLLFLFLPVIVRGQFTYVIDQTIPVQDITGNTLAMPWGGGLNAAQYSVMDLDQDGKDDLVLFDRMANKVITFLRQDNQYHYAPEYENMFPAGVTNWLLLRDYNCDGKKDIFTGDILGVKVYTNVTKAGQPLSWQQFLFSTGFPGSKSEVLLTQGFSSKINLQLQYDDLPAIVDADNDGDLDIFSMRFVGNGTVEFHQNFSKENGHGCDSLDFKRISQNWGDVKECSCGKFAFHAADCPPSGGRIQHAGGKSLLALDVNGDQQQDLIFSEASCNQLFLLRNEGTLSTPVINSSSSYPPAHPTNLVIFPAAYYEDVDFDGKKDLITSPNIYSKVFLASDLRQSNWLYKNTGSASNPDFTFVKSNFLQEDMIDVGDNAVPAFGDYDGDGDYDMFISRNSSAAFTATIFLYENIGTAKVPAFKLITDDYFNFSLSPYYNLKIQFTDINGDNTTDLVFTATSLTNGVTDLYYVANKSRNIFDFSDASIQPIDFTLTFSENLYITDVNEDGKPDILVGRSNGALEYYRNLGTQFQFSFENASFLGLGSSVLRQNITCAADDLNADGKTDLILGDQTGALKIISDYRHATDASHELSEIVFNPLLDTYSQQNLGGRTWPATVNIFNSTKPTIVVGNILGGVYILRNDEGESLPDNPVIDLYPNPVSRTGTLNLQTDRPAYVQIISLLGQRISDPVRVQAHELYNYKLPTLSAGLYFVKFSINDKSYTKRIVVY
jgi:hypothetical protein